MKDIETVKNYRLKYKRYYGIDFDENYVIHHIDFNRQNNDISNLLLLPKELHQKYHLYLTGLFPLEWETGKCSLDIKINQFAPLPYSDSKMFIDFLAILEECKQWANRKATMDFYKNNG